MSRYFTYLGEKTGLTRKKTAAEIEAETVEQAAEMKAEAVKQAAAEMKAEAVKRAAAEMKEAEEQREVAPSNLTGYSLLVGKLSGSMQISFVIADVTVRTIELSIKLTADKPLFAQLESICASYVTDPYKIDHIIDLVGKHWWTRDIQGTATRETLLRKSLQFLVILVPKTAEGALEIATKEVKLAKIGEEEKTKRTNGLRQQEQRALEAKERAKNPLYAAGTAYNPIEIPDSDLGGKKRTYRRKTPSRRRRRA